MSLLSFKKKSSPQGEGYWKRRKGYIILRGWGQQKTWPLFVVKHHYLANINILEF
jgi:hypothetical protein